MASDLDELNLIMKRDIYTNLIPTSENFSLERMLKSMLYVDFGKAEDLFCWRSTFQKNFAHFGLLTNIDLLYSRICCCHIVWGGLSRFITLSLGYATDSSQLVVSNNCDK